MIEKNNIICNIKMTSFILNNFILFSSVIIFIIAHRGVEETVAASLDATAPKEPSGGGDVHPTSIRMAHANQSLSSPFL
jgi:hypothetical protein